MQAEAWAQARSDVQKALAMRYRTSRDAGPKHDAISTGVMHPLASEIVKVCLPDGQAKPFPLNCLGLMTTSGAKGSNVNFSQISALLGQQVRLPALPCTAHEADRACLASGAEQSAAALKHETRRMRPIVIVLTHNRQTSCRLRL